MTLADTGNANSLTPGQNTIAADTAQTIPAGTSISEFLIDANSNGAFTMIGTVDP